MQEGDHIPPLRLFGQSRLHVAGTGMVLEESEKEHLGQCNDCQNALMIFVRHFKRQLNYQIRIHSAIRNLLNCPAASNSDVAA
jgi:hypothetical protein